MFIYLIVNLVNKKSYIGLTTKSINQRWKWHIGESQKVNPKSLIAKAMKKYGLMIAHPAPF